ASHSERRHSDAPPSNSRMAAFCVWPFFLVLCASGCTQVVRRASTQPDVEGISPPEYLDLIKARVTAPIGWVSRKIDDAGDASQIVWESPTGHTAYGVIHFTLPLPVGHDLALWGFLVNMKKHEGEANLVEKQWDPNLKCIRFVV